MSVIVCSGWMGCEWVITNWHKYMTLNSVLLKKKHKQRHLFPEDDTCIFADHCSLDL